MNAAPATPAPTDDKPLVAPFLRVVSRDLSFTVIQIADALRPIVSDPELMNRDGMAMVAEALALLADEEATRLAAGEAAAARGPFRSIPGGTLRYVRGGSLLGIAHGSLGMAAVAARFRKTAKKIRRGK